MIVLLLAACTSTPEPDLLWVSEAGGAPAVAGATLRLPPGATFPADPDPRGTHALIIATTEAADAHREALWLVPLDGGEGLELHSAERVRNPTWMPDGSAVVFESDARSYRDLYRVGRRGGSLERLTEARGGSFEPAVSADGTSLAFGSSRAGNAEIHVLSLQTGETVRHTHHRADDVQPRWTSDGRLAWLSYREGVPRVWITTPEGPQPLREGTTPDLGHAWSPTATTVAVTVGEPDGTTALELVADGVVRARIDGPGPDEHPAWAPDGHRLAFTSSRAGHPDVWVVDADGTDLEQLSHDGEAAWLPRWQQRP